MNLYRVQHFPQVPCDSFDVYCDDMQTARLVADALSNQHLWLLENNIIPDFSNVIVVEEMINGEWIDVEVD